MTNHQTQRTRIRLVLLRSFQVLGCLLGGALAVLVPGVLLLLFGDYFQVRAMRVPTYLLAAVSLGFFVMFGVKLLRGQTPLAKPWLVMPAIVGITGASFAVAQMLSFQGIYV